MSTVEERLAYLEAKVATLEEESSEALEANYLTYDPVAGVTGASFSGLVHALGLNLDAGTTNTPPDQDKVRWLRTSDGALVAELIGYSAGGVEVIGARAHALAAGDTSQAELDAFDDLGVDQAFIVVTQTARGNVAQVFTGAGTHSRTIIDQGGNSNFVQVAGGAQQLVLNGGKSNAVFTASQQSAQININHGLGRIPQIVLAMFDGFFGVLQENGGAPADAAQIHLIGWSLAGVTTVGVPFWWLAYG